MADENLAWCERVVELDRGLLFVRVPGQVVEGPGHRALIVVESYLEGRDVLENVLKSS
jgi:hypothetical protein